MTLDEELQIFDYHYFGSLWDETIKDEKNEHSRRQNKQYGIVESGQNYGHEAHEESRIW